MVLEEGSLEPGGVSTFKDQMKLQGAYVWALKFLKAVSKLFL